MRSRSSATAGSSPGRIERGSGRAVASPSCADPEGRPRPQLRSRGPAADDSLASGGDAKAVPGLPDGRILVAGFGFEERDRISSDWALARYTSTGRLDRSFGGDGIVVSSFGTGADSAGALARQADGKIVVAGEIYRDQAVAQDLSR